MKLLILEPAHSNTNLCFDDNLTRILTTKAAVFCWWRRFMSLYWVITSPFFTPDEAPTTRRSCTSWSHGVSTVSVIRQSRFIVTWQTITLLLVIDATMNKTDLFGFRYLQGYGYEIHCTAHDIRMCVGRYRIVREMPVIRKPFLISVSNRIN